MRRLAAFSTELPYEYARTLRQVNPSPSMYYYAHPEATIVGSSPEPLVQVLDGRVIIRPIAGTRFRGRTEEHDRRLAAELSRAERVEDREKNRFGLITRQ